MCKTACAVPGKSERIWGRRPQVTWWLAGGAGLLVVIVLVVGLIVRGRSDTPETDKGERLASPGANSPRQAHAARAQNVPKAAGEKILTYQVLKDDVYDSGLKAQVSLKLLLMGEITEAGVRNLLERTYQQTDKRTGFKFYSKPTHIFIYAYSDLERAESGFQWVGMLSKLGKGATPKISINSKLIVQLKEKPVERLGLSEAKRKEIWKELVRAEDRARSQAERQFPLEPGRSLVPGQVFRLKKITALMPELEPADPIAAIGRIRELRPGAIIRVVRVSYKRGKTWPWYAVEATSGNGEGLGAGWINSIALLGQSEIDGREQVKKQVELQRNLQKTYEADIAREHGLTAEQLKSIDTEAVRKQWPLPSLRK